MIFNKLIFVFSILILSSCITSKGKKSDFVKNNTLIANELEISLESDQETFYQQGSRFSNKYNSASGYVCRKAIDISSGEVKQVYCSVDGRWQEYTLFQ